MGPGALGASKRCALREGVSQRAMCLASVGRGVCEGHTLIPGRHG